MPHPLFRLAVVLLCLLGVRPAGSAEAPDVDAWWKDHSAELVSLYQHLHSHPELSFHEANTARRIADELKKAGAEVTTGVGQHGVVGVMKNGAGPAVLVRTDMDALPVVEETGLPYASRVKTIDHEGKEVGAMHACGHDVHMASLVGAARWLAEHKGRWSGTIVFIGQPAEERISGASAMLADGLYTRFPKPDFALALHVLADQPTGTVSYTPGPAMASSTSVDVVVRGSGGHGASPHATVDPIVLAALLVVDLQSIVGREVDPIDPAVVTVGSIHGGTKHNIIPNEVTLQLTLRAYREEVRELLIDGVRRRANGLAAAHRAPAPTVKVLESTPPTVNDPALVRRVVPALKRALGDSNVKEAPPVMGAEDFGLYARGGVPIFMLRLGSIPPGRVAEARSKKEILPSLHSARYRPDPEPSIKSGVRALTAAVQELLPKK